MILKSIIVFFIVVNLFAFPSDSLYNFDHKWISQNGKEVEFKDLSGKYKVVTLIYTNCTAACPLMVNNLKILDKRLNKKQRNNVEYLLFSIDPNDTPENLIGFHKKFGLNQRWTFFKGEEKNIRELASAIGFKYKKNQDGSFSHSTQVTLLNKEGQIVKSEEFSSDAKNLKEYIK